jgi:two-component system cell cycle sensor histidine kinase/response regulator CckA
MDGRGDEGDSARLAARLLELADAQRLMLDLFETAPVPLQVFDARGHSVVVNQKFLRTFGRSPPPEYCLLEDPILERQGILPLIRRAFAGETLELPPSWYDVKALPGFDHTGVISERMGVKATVVPLFGPDGAVEHVMVWGQNVTSELELDLREERQRLAFAAARVAAMDTNLTQGTLHLSDAAREMLGLDTDVPLATLDDLFALVHPEDVERFRAFELDRARPDPLDHAFRLVRPGKPDVAWLERRGQIWRDEVTEDVWRRGIVLDITERVAREQALQGSEAALRHTEAQLRQAQKLEAVGRLAGGIAHDFNNLLSVVIGYGDLVLRDPTLSAVSQEAVTAIRAAAEQASHLTKQLLALSRRQVLELRVLDVDQVVRSTAEVLRRLLGENIELLVRPASAPICARADASQLEQVVMNLAINARDAMPKGGTLTIETERVVLDQAFARIHLGVSPGPHVRLAMADTGVGMDKQTQSHIFEPFFTTKPKGKGTGLGLATVLGIVQQSGGHVFVFSEPGAGTRFEIYLPSVDGSAELPASTPAPATLNGSETVLLVEDQVEVRRVAGQILERYGYRVLEAASPAAALSICQQHEPRIDLLLTDVVMPHMNGRELAQRAVRLRPAMRVLYMSGYTEDAIDRQVAAEPGFALLQKPLVQETVARRVRELLDR